jgi:Bacterial Ig-like domain
VGDKIDNALLGRKTAEVFHRSLAVDWLLLRELTRCIMKRVLIGLVALISGLAGTAVTADEVTLESVPPVVAKTSPAAGEGEVDSKLTEIRVTFSKDMQDGSYSWVTHSQESFPKTDGQPKFLADKRTCVLPVKLEPGKTYALWLNSEKFKNFKDTTGRSAIPYLLVFRTKP